MRFATMALMIAKDSKLNFFRLTAYLEGISFLVLLGFAMPLKYIYHEPLAVKIVGWFHGMFFVGYLALLALLSSDQQWPGKKVTAAVLAAILPFGTFVFDRKLMKEQRE